ncbi:hypothetical protein [Psychromonas aquatilis]|uniref:Uncharacterized protein n=1 Tax=Psychromonas aquatilis TaxID=2005072 RepID=A0ABU9GNY7_9GAMM
MAKLWLTDKSYPIWGYVLRIAYWLLAIYISSQLLAHYHQLSWFTYLLLAVSVIFVVVYLVFTRFIDRFIKMSTKD